MSKKIIIILILALFIFLLVFYFFTTFSMIENYTIFLTISTFLFAIFAGFFIARQGNRYSAIRDQITKFDGEMSSVYRQFGHLDLEGQEEVRKIIKSHYELILKNKAWDYHFVHKSSTLKSIHQLAEKTGSNQALPSLKHLALQRILTALETLQVVRKNMIALYNERVPKFQWILIYFLAFILLLTVSIIPSQYHLLGAVLKGAFSVSVIFIIILLNKLDQLRFFENTIGENSARDILDIFVGKK